MVTLLKARGLYFLPNFLSEIPEGAMLEALNVVIDRNGIVEPRRGYKQWLNFGNSSSRAKQLAVYRDKILVHHDNKLSYQHTNNSGVEETLEFKTSDGVTDAVVVETETGRRLKYAESNGNLYVTTNSGIQRVSALTSDFLASTQENQILPAGVVQALDPQANCDYASSGWMVGFSKVAYKTLVGFTDNNDNLLLGAPSGRVVVTNLSSESCNVQLRLFLPSDLTTSFFVQVYRSNNPFADSIELLATTVEPNNELLQIAEILITQDDIDRGYIDYLDTVPAELQEVGDPLYSNQNTGEGSDQVNYAPPFAKDITLYKGGMFYANTKTRHTLDINLLSIEGIEDISISAASKSGTTISVQTSVDHGLSTNESVFVVIPNSTLDHTYTAVNAADNTLTNSTLNDGQVITSVAVPDLNLEANTFYTVRRKTATTIQLMKNPGNVATVVSADPGSYPRTLTQQLAVYGVYPITVIDSDEFSIQVNTNISLVGATDTDRAKNAKLFPAEFVVAKQDTVHEYFFGGNQGKFSISTTAAPSEDDYFIVNSYDRLRSYTFFLSANEEAPPLDLTLFPKTAGTIPANVVYTDTTLDLAIPLLKTETSDHYDRTTGIFTKVEHGFNTGDTIQNVASIGALADPFDNTTTYFVNKITDNTFTLSYTQGGAAIVPSGGAYTQAVIPNYRFNTSIDTTTDIITTASNNYTNSQTCTLAFSSTPPTVTGDALATNTTYYIKALSTTTLELYRDAALSTKVDFTGGPYASGTLMIQPATAVSLSVKSNAPNIMKLIADKMDTYGDWNSSTTSTIDFMPSAIQGGSPPYSQIVIPDHGLTSGDRAYISANGTGPTLTSPTLDKMPLDGYYVNVIDSDTIELYTTSDLVTNLVEFSDKGVGLLYLNTTRLTIQNITSGYFGPNTTITPYSSLENPDLYSTDFNVQVIDIGYGEYYDLTNQDFLVKRSRFPLVADKIDETARSLIRIINANNAQEVVTAYYTSGVQDFTPRMTFSSKLIDDVPIYFGFKDVNIPGYVDGSTNFEPALPIIKSASASASSGPNNAVTFTATNTLVAGQTVVIYDRTTDGVSTVASATGSSFVVNYSSAQLADSFNLWFAGDVSTKTEINPNRLYFSKFQQPDAVPLLNYIDIGPKNKAIERILPLKDSIIVLKEDGIYRVSGDVPNVIQTSIDFSNFILAPDSAVVLNNLVYVFTSQGVISVTENGTSVVSRFIENRLIPLSLFDNFKFSTFGVSYESDRAFLLFLPSAETDTVATQCYRYNTFTQAWTRWNKAAISGVIDNKSNRHYWGPDDINTIEQERKSFDRTDYSDREYSRTLINMGYDIPNKKLTLDSVGLIEIGDALVQTQYVSLGDMSILINKVAIDQGLPTVSASFYTTLASTLKGGSNIVTVISDFVDQLQIDITTTTFTKPTSADPETFQEQFNVLVTEMNSDITLQSNNYFISEGTKIYETSILAIENFFPVVTIDETPPFIEGDLVHMKRIVSDVTYAPISLGDPSIMKQVRETTTLFEKLTFKQAEMGYSTDLDAAFEFQSFGMLGSGAFGYGDFGRGVYGGGGLGPSYPFRTYIPLEKQRGRYWNLRFIHSYARFKYSLLGVSVTPSSQSERAYR